jgi:hypothetical protein
VAEGVEAAHYRDKTSCLGINRGNLKRTSVVLAALP